MTTNPYIEGYLETLGEKEDMLRRAHKLIIYGIYQWDKPIHEEIFDPVRIYCKEKNITFDNMDEIISKMNAAKAVFEDESSDKATIKAQAKILEALIVEIEDRATKDQPEILLKQITD